MPCVDIFDGNEEAEVILQSMKDDGIVGVSGGRMEVRAKLSEVQDLIDEEGLKGYWAQLTINHPDAELGYGYHEERYTMAQTKEYVTQAYDALIENNTE